MRTRPETSGQLELMPVMNLVAILIPMLLMGAQVLHLGVIDSTAPAIGPEGGEASELRLTVAITDRGLGVKAVPGALGADEDHQLGCTVQPCGVEGYDYRGLTDALARIKDDHPDETSLILLPEARVPYEVLIKVMDAAREDRSQQSEDGSPRTLFPQVMVAGGEV